MMKKYYPGARRAIQDHHRPASVTEPVSVQQSVRVLLPRLVCLRASHGLPVRGALLTKTPDSLFAEAHRVVYIRTDPRRRWNESSGRYEVEDGGDNWRVRREGRREIKHTSAWHMDDMTLTNTLSQCRVRHYHECGQTKENVTCEGVLFTPQANAAYCHQMYTISLQQNQKKWAPPVSSPLPPWGTGRRRRMSPLVLMKRNWFRTFFSRFSVETVHNCDCWSEVWSEFHRYISAWCVQWDIPVFPISLILLRGWTVGVVFLYQFIHAMHCSSTQSFLICESRYTESWI